MGNILLELKDVSFSAQDADILRGVSCTYEEGKTTALIGPSGSGKSTMLKLSAGLLLPTRGNVLLRGRDIADMNRQRNLAFRKESAVVFQDSALWANQSIYQNLELPLKIHYPEQSKQNRDKRIKEVLEDVGYHRDIHLRPAALSIGEQKLIAFARALLCSPRLMFLDEWTESLDDDSAGRLINIVRRMKEMNGTIIFVSHNLRIIRSLADHVLLIKNGELTVSLAKEEFIRDDVLTRITEGILS